MHPHKFSLDILKRAIDKASPVFPEDRRKVMLVKLEEFLANRQVTSEEISRAIADFGKEMRPYRRAWEEIYKQHGLKNEKEYIFKNLKVELHPQCERYLKEGDGKIGEYCSPEEIVEIEKAQFKAKDVIQAELTKIIREEKQDEFQELFNRFQEEGKIIEERIKDLKKIASTYPELSEEISESVRTFEEGFSVVERDVNVFDVEKKVEYYKGRLGLL